MLHNHLFCVCVYLWKVVVTLCNGTCLCLGSALKAWHTEPARPAWSLLPQNDTSANLVHTKPLTCPWGITEGDFNESLSVVDSHFSLLCCSPLGRSLPSRLDCSTDFCFANQWFCFVRVLLHILLQTIVAAAFFFFYVVVSYILIMFSTHLL